MAKNMTVFALTNLMLVVEALRVFSLLAMMAIASSIQFLQHEIEVMLR